MDPKIFSHRIISKIKEQHICPHSRCRFLLKNGLFWAVFAISILVGARAVGVIIFNTLEIDANFMALAHGPILPPLIKLLPLFWIIFFLLFLFLAASGLHHTRKGYKLSLFKLVGINLILSAIIGTGFHLWGDAENLERNMTGKIPLFKSLEERQKAVWSDPEAGRLAGTIISLRNGSVLILGDFQNKTWIINYQEQTPRPPVELQTLMRIRIVGELEGQNHFNARAINLWENHLQHMNMMDLKENLITPRINK